jgi:predicted nucleotidyltransferase
MKANLNRGTSVAEKIQEMVRRIVKRFDPERIILFGSSARGTPTPDSDVDLLVVMQVKGPRREKAIEIGVALQDIRIPKDIIVVTPEAFEWRQHVVGTIEWPAVREGKVLCARP